LTGIVAPGWQSFSLNPGLRRLKEYRLCTPFAGFDGEKALSLCYAQLNLTAVTLEGDAVLHSGFGVHVEVPIERRRKRRQQIKLSLILLLGVCIGWLIN
jgi:hypothetical protein